MGYTGGSKNDIAETRRERVAALRLRGLTTRQIAAALERSGLLNPDNGKPYSHVTVKNDLDVIREQWKQSAQENGAEFFSSQLAELSGRRGRRRGRIRT